MKDCETFDDQVNKKGEKGTEGQMGDVSVVIARLAHSPSTANPPGTNTAVWSTSPADASDALKHRKGSFPHPRPLDTNTAISSTIPISTSIVRALDHHTKSSVLAEKLGWSAALFATIPMLVSFGTCAACAVFSDWYSFSMILLGIFCSGVSCYVIGSAELRLEDKELPSDIEYGDGLLMEDDQFVILLGSRDAVNFVTKGQFTLRFPRWTKNKNEDTERIYRSVGRCSFLLLIQFLAQLLIIPQGTLFGQIMFLASMGVSWVYNLYLSSVDKELIQRRMLLKVLEPDEQNIREKYTFKNRKSRAIFIAKVYDDRARKEQETAKKHCERRDMEGYDARLKQHRRQRMNELLQRLMTDASIECEDWRSCVVDYIVPQDNQQGAVLPGPTNDPRYHSVEEKDIKDAESQFEHYLAPGSRRVSSVPSKHVESPVKDDRYSPRPCFWQTRLPRVFAGSLC